jgi:glycosyltransferase involved in cell wall biosynthesis
MKILLVGSEPYATGGVPNYVRPLALKFVELGHNVSLFYSGAYFRRYNWLLRPYLRINNEDYPFEYAELVNSPGLAHNYGFPLMDVSCSRSERVFLDYIKKTKPDIMHVHSVTGLPVSIMKIAAEHGARVFYTVHEYGALCQKTVMIDEDGKLCPGPVNLEKCADCTEPINLRKSRFMARIENTNKRLLELLVRTKRSLAGTKKAEANAVGRHHSPSAQERRRMMDELKKRFDCMIFAMDHHVVTNICVSSDVKRIFGSFGVSEKKLLVQHIGSAIAERQQTDKRLLHDPLVLGNIGGVDYYKGTHVLLDAIGKIKNNNFVVKIYGKYEKPYFEKLVKGMKKLPVEFFGQYAPEDLSQILEQIDVMILPSICNDTAPQTMFESFSARIPIIASNIGGFPDFIQDGVNGYLFRPGDSQNLANKLNHVLDHPHVIYELSEKVPKLKTIKENALELIVLYENALQGKN